MADLMAGAPAPMDSAAVDEGDLSQGYCIEISVLPDGTFKVSGPEPLAAEAAEEQGEAGSEMGQDFDTLGAALKRVLQVVKENPMGADAGAQLEAGYASR